MYGIQFYELHVFHPSGAKYNYNYTCYDHEKKEPKLGYCVHIEVHKYVQRNLKINCA